MNCSCVIHDHGHIISECSKCRTHRIIAEAELNRRDELYKQVAAENPCWNHQEIKKEVKRQFSS